jgi:hypothetical protein
LGLLDPSSNQSLLDLKMVAFFKQAYGREKDADKFLFSQQPALKYTWDTMVTSSFWDMRLSIACAATDAEFQNRMILPEVRYLHIAE